MFDPEYNHSDIDFHAGCLFSPGELEALFVKDNPGSEDHARA